VSKERHPLPNYRKGSPRRPCTAIGNPQNQVPGTTPTTTPRKLTPDEQEIVDEVARYHSREWADNCHRGQQQVIAKAETQSAAWGEAARLARLADA
jgi:hypothetical protein